VTISITGTGTASGKFIFCDGTRELAGPLDLDIRPERQVQISKRFRATAIRARNRYNIQTTVSFNVARLHDGPSTAESFALDHITDVPAEGTIYFEEMAGDGLIRRKMDNAIVTSWPIKVKGATTQHSYTIVGGIIEKVSGVNT